MLGNRIRSRREELGMSQEELAKLLGYKSRSSINKVELGENDLPQSKIKAFADALQTTPGYLMGWDVPGKKQEDAEDLANRILTNTKLKKILPLIEAMDEKDLDLLAEFLKRFVK